MDALFQPLAHLTGASLDQIKLIICLVVSYPLGSIYARLPRSLPALKHIFSIVVSAIFLLPILNLWPATLHLLVSVLATYILTNTLRGPNMPWVVFAVNMGLLTINHTYRTIYDIPHEKFDITGPQMVLTMKLIIFAWNVWDGRCPTEELDKWQLKHRVVTMPSLLEFLGYAFFFPGTLVGPYTEYATYASLVNGSLFESVREDDRPRVGHVPQGRKRVAYTRMGTGFACLGLFVVLGGKFTYHVVLTDSWSKKSFLNRLFIVQVIGFVERLKYYAVWLLSEGACILTGLGFTGYTASGDSRWDGTANVNILLIEWPSNFKVFLDSWNMKTNAWLRETMYKRVTPKGKKPGFNSSMVTFVTSAFWHGIAGGYYLTFVLGGFATTVGRLCRANFRPLVLPPVIPPSNLEPGARHPEADRSPPSMGKRLYDFVGTLATLVVVNFAAAPFVVGGFHDSLEAWRRMDWYGLWLVGGLLVFFTLGGKRCMKRLAVRRVSRIEKRREEETKGVKVFIPNGGK